MNTCIHALVKRWRKFKLVNNMFQSAFKNQGYQIGSYQIVGYQIVNMFWSSHYIKVTKL